MPGYAFDQCAFFKLRSKARLANLLCTSQATLKALTGPNQYKLFKIPETTCEFTGKPKKSRNVEEPKRELRRIHDRIRDLLSRVELVSYAHAAVKHRSYRSNAKAHQYSDVVATFDIEQFYPSTSQEHVKQFFFQEMQCSADVASLLSKVICYCPTPGDVGRLPTGSPVSPIISIYANKPMFDALNRLARSSGLIFTCYVDDITFSGARQPPKLCRRVESIVSSHGHKINKSKTRFFGKGSTKHITGVVVRDGKIAVPHSRFFKARKIEERINEAGTQLEKIRLTRKLSGLLGEAASIDERYRPLAEAAYSSLNHPIYEKVITISGEIIFTKKTDTPSIFSPILPADDIPPWD
ncbi:reverse transcriptase family protein [Delftia sp. PS-11]|uniref:reverse transcriptase family protein n=1 Tax=Delftia sp. PS-11 TaxID=2767222 RepID=UPI002455E694|nr:reverse transcriptase family protein [Delftia sp. PS-11]KAJ8745423.1 RNA-directed DNA polymerase [Delftia sp. PS-11]